MSNLTLFIILAVVLFFAIAIVRARTNARREKTATRIVTERLAHEGRVARSIEERVERSKSGDWREPRTKTSTKKPRPRKASSVRSHTRSRAPNNGSRARRATNDDGVMPAVVLGAAILPSLLHHNDDNHRSNTVTDNHTAYDPPSDSGDGGGGE